MRTHNLVLIHLVHLTNRLLISLDRIRPLLGRVSEGRDRVSE